MITSLNPIINPARAILTPSKSCLGEPPETLLDLEFGKDGQPFYISGPYENPDKILKTLRENVGEGNFHYVISTSEFSQL